MSLGSRDPGMGFTRLAMGTDTRPGSGHGARVTRPRRHGRHRTQHGSGASSHRRHARRCHPAACPEDSGCDQGERMISQGPEISGPMITEGPIVQRQPVVWIDDSHAIVPGTAPFRVNSQTLASLLIRAGSPNIRSLLSEITETISVGYGGQGTLGKKR